MESRKNKSGNSAILTKVLAIIAASIPAISYIATALINRKSRKEAIDAKGEKDKEVHKQANLDDFDFEKKKSDLRVEEKRQMLELELEYKSKIAQQKQNPNEDTEPLSKSSNSGPVSFTQIQTMDVPPIIPLAGEYLDTGTLCTIVADPGVGKTTMAYQMAYNIAHGQQAEFVSGEFPSFPAMKVLYYDGENSKADLNRLYGKCPIEDTENLRIYPKIRFRSIDEMVSHIESQVNGDMKDCAVIIDNVFKFMNASSQAVMAQFFDEMEALQEKMFEHGKVITIVILDHTSRDSKDEFMPVSMKKMGGASHIPRFSKAIINLFPIKGRENMVGVKLTKDRFHGKKTTVDILERIDEPIPGFKYLDTVSVEEIKNGYQEQDEGSGPSESQKQLIIQLCNSNPKPSDKDIAKQLNIAPRTFANWKKELGLTATRRP